MQILRAKVMGFCFGVRDALTLTEKLEHPEDVSILGELVHNEQVLHQLERRGFSAVSESHRDEIPCSPEVLITAHGISEVRRTGLLAAGKILHDTTCPLVRNVHRAAQRLANEERHIIVIGRPNHVEVLGIVEDLASYSIFANADDVVPTGKLRLGIVCQSTTSPGAAQAVRQRIVVTHPGADIRWVDTICQPTKDRQQAVEDLLPRIDVLIVIGGARSNNTRALAEIAERRGVRVHLVQSADDLRREWFYPADRVGLTAGTSTPDDAIAAVADALENYARSFQDQAVAAESTLCRSAPSSFQEPPS